MGWDVCAFFNTKGKTEAFIQWVEVGLWAVHGVVHAASDRLGPATGRGRRVLNKIVLSSDA